MRTEIAFAVSKGEGTLIAYGTSDDKGKLPDELLNATDKLEDYTIITGPLDADPETGK